MDDTVYLHWAQGRGAKSINLANYAICTIVSQLPDSIAAAVQTSWSDHADVAHCISYEESKWITELYEVDQKDIYILVALCSQDDR